jgi:membrane associated rhomboid family serine protease
MISLRPSPEARFPLVTCLLVMANLLVFWYEFSLGEARLERFFDLWGVVPRALSSFDSAQLRASVLVTPLTSMYLHVGTLHLATNMLYLWVFGAPVERLLGRLRFLGFYTACGLMAVALQVLAWPASAIPAVGASGAVAGLLAGNLMLRPGSTVGAVAPSLFYFPAVDLPAALMLGLWLLSQVLSAVLTATEGSGGGSLAWVAHLGGFVSGLALVFLFRPRRRRTYHW